MSAVPVRGTQSFVAVMAEVFRRPSLTGLEVLWRWVFWGVVLVRPAHWLLRTGGEVIGSFQSGGFVSLGRELMVVSEELKLFTLGHLGSCAAVLGLWLLLSAGGRAMVLRRAGGALRPSFPAMLLLGGVRWCFWALAIALWGGGLFLALRLLVFGPQASGAGPAWVPFCGALIAGTLVLFVLWLGTSWVFPLAAIFAAQGKGIGGSLRAVVRRDALAGKLAEINLVTGIVKIALLVLLLVFSACPLPFETVETQSFLLTWTAGVLLLYFAASDYFHVVRLVAFLRMTEVLSPLPQVAATRDGKTAS